MPGVPFTESSKTLMPLFAVTGRYPGWGGINLALQEEFIFPWEAHDSLNFTNRTGLASDNIGVLATRPGYADDPHYQMIGGNKDSTETYGPGRMKAKFYPGAVEVSGGTDVDFNGSGLNDLTVNTTTSDGSTYVLKISKGTPTVVFDGLGVDDLTVDDETAIDGEYLITINTGDPTDPNTFDWTKDGAGGATDVAITGASQTLDAINVTFVATTGHFAGDTFTIKADEFDWTRDGYGGVTGVTITGAEQTLGTDGPGVTFAAITGHTENDKFSIVPPTYIKQSVQVLELVQTAAGANQSIFKKWDGGSWTTITGSLKNLMYPQYIVMGLPTTPLFCWIDLQNGLHVYDGTTDTAQNIPKYSNTAQNITGALWLDQLDGRLLVAGNWVDTAEGNVLYYSAAGSVTSVDPDDSPWKSHNGGGAIPIYGADSKSGASPPKHIMGLATLHGMAVVFTEDMRYLVAGIGTLGQQVREFPGCGCFSGKCIVKYGDSLYWWGKDGAYKWAGGEPTRISDPIWNKVGNLKLTSAYKWFSYVYQDQWVTCVRYKSSGVTGLESSSSNDYYRFIYDLKAGTWHVDDVPMVAAFTTKTGLADIGRLYFCSPVANGDSKYQTYCYGWDEVDQNAVYADAVSGVKGSRTGTAITSTWETGKLDGGNPTAQLPSLAHLNKDWEKFKVRIAVAGTGTFTHARLQYRMDDDTDYTNLNVDTTNLTKPFQYLGFSDTNHHGHLMQARFSVSATKRLVIKRIYVQFKGLSFSESQG